MTRSIDPVRWPASVDLDGPVRPVGSPTGSTDRRDRGGPAPGHRCPARWVSGRRRPGAGRRRSRRAGRAGRRRPTGRRRTPGPSGVSTAARRPSTSRAFGPGRRWSPVGITGVRSTDRHRSWRSTASSTSASSRSEPKSTSSSTAVDQGAEGRPGREIGQRAPRNAAVDRDVARSGEGPTIRRGRHRPRRPVRRAPARRRPPGRPSRHHGDRSAPPTPGRRWPRTTSAGADGPGHRRASPPGARAAADRRTVRSTAPAGAPARRSPDGHGALDRRHQGIEMGHARPGRPGPRPTRR